MIAVCDECLSVCHCGWVVYCIELILATEYDYKVFFGYVCFEHCCVANVRGEIAGCLCLS